MDISRKYSIRFSGPLTPGGHKDRRHDGKMTIEYVNMFSNHDIQSISSGIIGGKKTPYASVFSEENFNTYQKYAPLMLNYSNFSLWQASKEQGLYGNKDAHGSTYSFYRREYDVYSSSSDLESENVQYKSYKGEWEPVAINISGGHFYDFNITSGRNYQYIMYPYADIKVSSEMEHNLKQTFANYDGRIWDKEMNVVQAKANFDEFVYRNLFITSWSEFQDDVRISYWVKNKLDPSSGQPQMLDDKYYRYFFNSAISTPAWQYDEGATPVDNITEIEGYTELSQELEEAKNNPQPGFGEGRTATAYKNGSPIRTTWDAWSLIELEPINIEETIGENTPAIKKAYKANLDQLWLFKYSLETGSQTQNISRNEFQTLGEYSKIGYGKTNYISGEVSAYLGSEIVPGYKEAYIERLRKSKVAPLSTNEKMTMLEQWRKLVSSKNPKLLRDIKGQSWIVQIMSGSNTPHNFYNNQPDKISFQWKQIESTEKVSIYSTDSFVIQEDSREFPWQSIF